MTRAPRLSPADLAARQTRPGVGVVHLGLGAFFRAHGALYIAEAMEQAGGDWGIVGASLRSPEQRDRLKPQGYIYTAVEKGPDGIVPRMVDVVQDVLVAREDPRALIERLVDPAVRLVTLTVTEKGYCHEPATGALDPAHPDILHDIAHPEAPISAPGYLLRALDLRRQAGHRPFTALSCDNLPANGRVLRRVVVELAHITDPGLAGWIEAEARFPSSMVDRIVPATTPEDIADLAGLTGRLDFAPVLHEPFRQWVIEDDFVDGDRPALERAGAQMVTDVTPYEHMKLRCLNGTHSALAYLGYLSGRRTVYETATDPAFARFCQTLWRDEVIPTLAPPGGTDLAAYAKALLARYQNPAISHSTWQIAMDGSQKLPQRILATIADNIAAARPCPGLMLAVAAWMKYASGIDQNGGVIDVRDPLAEKTRGLWQANPDAATRVAAYMKLREVFGPLADNPAFREGLVTACARLETDGAYGAVSAVSA